MPVILTYASGCDESVTSLAVLHIGKIWPQGYFHPLPCCSVSHVLVSPYLHHHRQWAEVPPCHSYGNMLGTCWDGKSPTKK